MYNTVRVLGVCIWIECTTKNVGVYLMVSDKRRMRIQSIICIVCGIATKQMCGFRICWLLIPMMNAEKILFSLGIEEVQ
jgi:hypothetical protein